MSGKRKGIISVICKDCGNTFIAQACNQKFCSSKCREIFYLRPLPITLRVCIYCGKQFESNHSHQRFCCIKCRTESRKDHDYFDGHRRQAIGYQERQCWVCQKTELKRIHVHHVLRKRQATLPLLVVLCPGCHRLIGLLGQVKLLADPRKVADLITLARFEAGLDDKRTVIIYEENK